MTVGERESDYMKNISKALMVSGCILVGTSSIPFPTMGIETTEASSTIEKMNGKFQNTSNLVLREKPGTNYKKLITIPKGAILTVTLKQDKWYKVSYTYKYNGKNTTKTGWVDGTYLKEYNKYTTQPTKYYFTNKTAKLYSTPDTKKKEVYSVASNNGFSSTQVVLNSSGQTWYRVYYKGKYLFIRNTDVVNNTFTTFTNTKYKATKDTYVYQYYGTIFSKLVSVPKNTIISTSKKIGNFYYVSYGGKKGYINIADFTNNINEVKYETTPTTYYFTKNLTKYYTAPGDTQEVASIEGNNGFASTQKATDQLGEVWYRISYNGQDYYINSVDVTANTFLTFTNTNYKATKETYVYESFGSQFKKLVTVPINTVVASSKKIGNWYSVTYNGQTGYINISDFIKNDGVTVTDIPDKNFTTTAELNLRVSYDASSDILTVIPKSATVVATHKASNNWYKVTYNGQTGFVSGAYLKEVTTDPEINRDTYQFVDLRTQSSVTAKQINDYIAAYVNLKGKKSVLTGQGQLFIDAGKQYGVNALYLAAHAIHESGYGTSAISLGKSNLFGFGSYDATAYIASYKFSSVKENIAYIAREMKTTYLNPNNWKYNGAYLGYTTKDANGKRIDAKSEGMNFYYASDSNWGKAISQHMEKILPYDKNYYKSAQINTTIPTAPVKPEGSDVFPVGIQAVADSSLNLFANKGDITKVKAITTGTSFILLEKTNDYWVKLMVDDTVYWTNTIKFDVYGRYVSVKNLGRILIDGLNVRSAPTTSGNNIIAQFNLNDYINIVTLPNGSLEMDYTKSWYKVQIGNGMMGWISTSYVAQELK